MFDRTVQEMGERLLTVRAPAQMMDVLAWSMAELDKTYAKSPAGVRALVACRAGCDACCSVPVDVQAHEVFFAADHIQRHFSPAALEQVLDRLSGHRLRVSHFAVGARNHSRQPCVLLDKGGSCSIYAGRPEACRCHHSSNAAVCAANQSDPAVNITKAYIPALRARLFAVRMGVDEAIEAADYDDRAYDFGSALHEALTNSLCLVAWLRRQPAFADSCLSQMPC
jgi:Fe-S-cluster containining protein